MSGFSSRFEGNENIIRIQGMGISGLLTNLIALVCTICSEQINVKYQFLIYLLFGDVFIYQFYIMKTEFYKECLTKVSEC